MTGKQTLKIFSLRYRKGMTLVEMGLATAVAAVFCMMVALLVNDGLRLQMLAGKKSLAAALAQTKMSQLLSRPVLEPGTDEGTIGSDGMYAGYAFNLTIKEEQLDLAQVVQEGKLEGMPVDDKMPADVRNTEGDVESLGTGPQSQTGGMIPVYRIVLVITYPIGQNRTDSYRVETFRSARQTLRADEVSN